MMNLLEGYFTPDPEIFPRGYQYRGAYALLRSPIGAAGQTIASACKQQSAPLPLPPSTAADSLHNDTYLFLRSPPSTDCTTRSPHWKLVSSCCLPPTSNVVLSSSTLACITAAHSLQCIIVPRGPLPVPHLVPHTRICMLK